MLNRLAYMKGNVEKICQNSPTCAQLSRGLRLLTHVGISSKTSSDTFRSVLVYGQGQESRKKNISLPSKRIHVPEKV